MVGCAVTVRVAAGDNKHTHMVLDPVQPGDLIVVNGTTTPALIGGIMVAIAKSRGAAGFVLHGAVRDTAEIRADTFPVVVHAAIYRGRTRTEQALSMCRLRETACSYQGKVEN